MNELQLMSSEENKRWTRWAGGDLGPLPHESSLTVFWRFCWRNTLDEREVSEHFGASGQAIDWAQFKRVTGWRCPETIELRLQRLPSRELLFDTHMRYCPICLECAYHSVWHQFRALRSCPLHDVPLRSECCYCGHATAPLSEHLNCRAKPFCCKSCSQYLAGAEPDLDLHLDLLDQAPAICARMDGLERWVTQNHELLALVRGLLRPVFQRAEKQTAFDRLLYRFIDQMAPSRDFALSDGQPVGVLIWQIVPYRASVERHFLTGGYHDFICKW
ncbi:hypothetical protein B0G74_4663 [Paraburkholderia sp. BL9I2N2]|nr:hypothetical protein B0G74_4663 [Paraburkholderia sp. BL9I2N2]